MTLVDEDLMLVRFVGTYTMANPSGARGSKVVKPFDVKVKMHKRFLAANGLRGAFDTYYKQSLKQKYPGMIDLNQFEMIEATEIDGRKIANPKCMSHDDTIAYIKSQRYAINIALYDSQDLRHQVVLYEKDKDGQQKLQSNIMSARGGAMAIAEEIKSMNDVFEILEPEDLHHSRAAQEHQQGARRIQHQEGRLVGSGVPTAQDKDDAVTQSFSDLFGGANE
jgi:hypothetical protein